MSLPKLEIACFNLSSALIASSAGATRIELCANVESGGTTPAIDTLEAVKAQVRNDVLVHVMIRPRGGDFVYSESELENMKLDMHNLFPLADGFVFGILTSRGDVDRTRCEELVAAADGKPCVFHRAFDELNDMEPQLGLLKGCGFKAVLTSGGANTAIEGIQKLKTLMEVSRSIGLDLIVGGGVRTSNIVELRDSVGANWFHSSALSSGQSIASVDEIETILQLLK